MSHAISQTTTPARTSQWVVLIGLVVAGVVLVCAHFARSLPSSPPGGPAAETGSEKQLPPAAPERIYRDPGGPGRRF